MDPKNLDKLVPGLPVPAATLAGFAGAVEQLSARSPSAPLGGHDAAGGPAWRDDREKPFHAQLSAPFSPYSWDEVTRDGTTSAWRIIPGGRSGVENAYEYNGAARLEGKVEVVMPVGGSWYKFVHPRYGSGGTGECYFTVHLEDCAGIPIPGATCTTYDAFGATVTTGTTDASGNYTFPSTSGIRFTIAYDGASQSFTLPASGLLGVLNCDNPFNLVFDKAVVTVTAPAGSDLTANITDAHGFTPVPSVDDSTPGTWIYTFKGMHPRFSILDPFPMTACFTARLAGHIPYCAATAIACNDAISLDLPLYDYTADYWSYDIDCDTGCGNPSNSCDGTIVGEGPNYRGVFPKVLYTAWTAPGPPDRSASLFGSFAGVPIAVTWDAVHHRWDSGCLGGGGVSCGGAYGPYYQSSRVTIVPSGGGGYQATFTFYGEAGCVAGDVDLGECVITGDVAGGSTCSLAAPVDVVFGGFDNFGFGFVPVQCHVTQ